MKSVLICEIFGSKVFDDPGGNTDGHNIGGNVAVDETTGAHNRIFAYCDPWHNNGMTSNHRVTLQCDFAFFTIDCRHGIDRAMRPYLDEVLDYHAILRIDICENAYVRFVPEPEIVLMLNKPVVLGGLAFLDLRGFPIFKPIHRFIHRLRRLHGLGCINETLLFQ